MTNTKIESSRNTANDAAPKNTGDNTAKKGKGGVIVAFVILAIIASLLLALVIGNFITVFRLMMFPEKLPSYFGQTYVVAGDGSIDGISRGDLSSVKKIPADEYKVGDVVVDWYNGALAMLRITEIDERGNGLRVLTLKNDVVEDPEIPDEKHDYIVIYTQKDARKIIGAVTGTYEGVGHVLLFSQSLLGRILLIGVPLFGYVIYYICAEIKLGKAEKKAKESEDKDGKSAEQK